MVEAQVIIPGISIIVSITGANYCPDTINIKNYACCQVFVNSYYANLILHFEAVAIMKCIKI